MSASATAVIASLADPGSWTTWDAQLPVPDGADHYDRQRRDARARAGTDEAVLSGQALIDGRRVALIVSEFGYLAGSIGDDAADRIIRAYERATDERLAVIAAPVSGGTRMQEGTPAFLRMAGIAAAAADHRAAGLPSLVLLRGPTAGGVLASWGSLGQVALAEPGALIGFLGPRVYQEVTGAPFPAGVQLSEHLMERGIIDGVGPLPVWRDAVVRFLNVVGAARSAPTGSRPTPGPEGLPPRPVPLAPPVPDPTAWPRVAATRAPGRPGAVDLIRTAATDILQLTGTGAGEPARGLILALARIGGNGVVVVAQDRTAQSAGGLIGPWSLRAAQRGMRLAAELRLPLVTVIDTPGAELSRAAEEGAMAGEIARCLASLSRLPTPTIAVLLGQGSGGGAIALLPCDRVVAAENAWVTPLPPEGAAAIIHRDAGRAPEMASRQRITAAAMASLGAVDVVVPESGDWIGAIAGEVSRAVDELSGPWDPQLMAARRRRWRSFR